MAHQLTLRAFQTNKCDEFGEGVAGIGLWQLSLETRGQHVLVYSPASLQWTAVPERAKAAVTVADQEASWQRKVWQERELGSSALQMWLWVKTNDTFWGRCHPFCSILVGIGMFTGGTGF